MPRFRYVAKDEKGNTLNGVIEAVALPDVLSSLREQGLIVVNVKEERGRKRGVALGTGGKIKLSDLVVFSRQLATLVEAGIPLIQGLEILEKQIEKRDFKSVIRDIARRIEEGSSLSEGLSKHPKVFPQLFVNIVKAGESSGTLDAILDRLAIYLEKTDNLQRKVKASLIYPAAVTGMAVVITLFLIIKIIPTFKGIFDTLGAQLPLPTRVLLGISDFTRQYFLLVTCGVILLGIGFSIFIKTDFGRLKFDGFKLKVKIFGPLLKKVAISNFTRTLSTLVKSGVPILNALGIVGKTSGNRVIEDAIGKVRESVRQGESIAAPLGNFPVFPPLVTRMIDVGEQTGRLEDMLSKIADFYDEQVEVAVAGLTSMIEPMIIVFLGVVIGSVVLAMFLPIFKMVELVSG